jgi:hypothetical protein
MIFRAGVERQREKSSIKKRKVLRGGIGVGKPTNTLNQI